MSSTRQIVALVLAAILLSTIFTGFLFWRFQRLLRPQVFEFHAMGTLNQIKIYDQPANATAAAAEIQSMLQDLESKTNLIDGSSEVAQLNRQRRLRISLPLYAIIERCLYYAHWSKGAFDPTVGALTLAYKVGEGQPLPSPETIAVLRKSVDYRLVKLDPETRSVALLNPLAQLDVWGAAKGYAADQALAILKQRKIRAAMIDMGGQISVWGKRPFHSVWNVGIEDPRVPQRLLTTVILKSGDTLASSSASQRFDRHGKSVTGHIFDPHTGQPVQGMQSVSIICQSGLDADIMSTTIFVLGTAAPLKANHSFRYVTLDAKGELLLR